MSLARVLEPEVMDTFEEARDYDAMDHSEVNRRFVDDLLASGPLGLHVLDLGTGTALIPIELCRREETCLISAIDLSVQMLDLARYNIEVASLITRIRLGHCDSKALPFAPDSFSVVMSNSIIHHIPEPLMVLREAVRVVQLGGLLFFRDLLRPPDLTTLHQLVDTYAADADAHQRQMFADSLHAALTLEEVRTAVVSLGFAPETVQATSDRHWTWAARKVSG